jgi:hypothetical protein
VSWFVVLGLHSYPYVSCEIIVSDISELLGVIASPTNLDILFSMFDQPAPLNPLVASYGCRVIWFLFTKRAEVLEYMRKKPDFLASAMRHLASSPVADLLARLAKQEETNSDEVLEVWRLSASHCKARLLTTTVMLLH